MDDNERVSYETKPPDDYVFVPKGNAFMTRNCRSLSKKVDMMLYCVYNRDSRLKLGVHCHTQVFEAVEADAAATADRRERAVAAKDSLDYQKNRDMLFGFFPSIPLDSASDILAHGFLKGSGRVGRAKVLDDELRFHLAVNAHIRHNLTLYESILFKTKTGQGRGEMKRAARNKVHTQVQEIADSWRDSSRVNSTPAETSNRSLSIIDTSAAGSEVQFSQPKARKVTKQDCRIAKAREDVLTFLNSGDTPKKTKMSMAAQEATLETALRCLNFGEGSDIPLTRAQRRKAAIQDDLDKLKQNPDHPIEYIRLAKALELHRNQGGSVTSLGSDAVARMKKQVESKAVDQAARKEERNAIRERKRHLPQKSRRNLSTLLGSGKKPRHKTSRTGQKQGKLGQANAVDDRSGANIVARRPLEPISGLLPSGGGEMDEMMRQSNDTRRVGNPSGNETLGDDSEWMDIS